MLAMRIDSKLTPTDSLSIGVRLLEAVSTWIESPTIKKFTRWWAVSIGS
jgi:hypothetical protein